MKSKFFKIENYFFLCLIFYGLLYIVITPPFYSSDEEYHFIKSNSKENIYIYGKTYFPEKVSEFIQPPFGWGFNKDNYNYKYNLHDFKKLYQIEYNNKLVENTVPFTKGYSFSSYIFSKTGIYFSKLFSNKVFFSFYFGRLFNLLFSIIIITLILSSLEGLPKIILFSIISMPMSISLLSSNNQDCSLITYACLLFYFCKKVNENTFLSKNYKIKLFSKEIAIKTIYINFLFYYIFLLLIIIPKPVYILLSLLPIIYLISFNNNKIYSISINYFNKFFLTIFFIFSIIAVILIVNYPKPTPINLENLNILYQKPVLFLKILISDYRNNYQRYTNEMIGVLGHVNIMLPKICYYYFKFIFVYYLITFFLNKNYTKRNLIICLTLVLCVISMQLSFYLYFTGFDEKRYIQGIHGRYFIILLIMANLLFLKNISNNLSKLKIIKFMNNFIVFTVPHINIFSLYSLVNFFYFK